MRQVASMPLAAEANRVAVVAAVVAQRAVFRRCEDLAAAGVVPAVVRELVAFRGTVVAGPLASCSWGPPCSTWFKARSRAAQEV